MDWPTTIAAVYAAAYVTERERIYRSGYYLNPDDATRHDIADRVHRHATYVAQEATAAMMRGEMAAHEEIDANAP